MVPHVEPSERTSLSSALGTVLHGAASSTFRLGKIFSPVCPAIESTCCLLHLSKQVANFQEMEFILFLLMTHWALGFLLLVPVQTFPCGSLTSAPLTSAQLLVPVLPSWGLISWSAWHHPTTCLAFFGPGVSL